MWILERFFAISKRRESRGFRRFGILLGFVAILTASCVVTDKITFEDAENQPFSVVKREPEDQVIGLTEGTTKTFSVWFWDPDSAQSSDSDAQGFLTLTTDYWLNVIEFKCSAPTLDEAIVYKQEGSVFRIDCLANISSVEGIIEGSPIAVSLSLSDLGFLTNTSEQPRKNAHLATLTWVVRVEITEQQ